MNEVIRSQDLLKARLTFVPDYLKEPFIDQVLDRYFEPDGFVDLHTLVREVGDDHIPEICSYHETAGEDLEFYARDLGFFNHVVRMDKYTELLERHYEDVLEDIMTITTAYRLVTAFIFDPEVIRDELTHYCVEVW